MGNRLIAVIAAGFLLVAGSACNQEGDCEKVVDKLIELTKASIPADKQAQVEVDRAARIEQCKQDGVTKKVEACVLSSTTLTQVNSCGSR